MTTARSSSWLLPLFACWRSSFEEQNPVGIQAFERLIGRATTGDWETVAPDERTAATGELDGVLERQASTDDTQGFQIVWSLISVHRWQLALKGRFETTAFAIGSAQNRNWLGRCLDGFILNLAERRPGENEVLRGAIEQATTEDWRAAMNPPGTQAGDECPCASGTLLHRAAAYWPGALASLLGTGLDPRTRDWDERLPLDCLNSADPCFESAKTLLAQAELDAELPDPGRNRERLRL